MIYVKRWLCWEISLVPIIILSFLLDVSSASPGAHPLPLAAELSFLERFLIRILSTGVTIADDILDFWVVSGNLTDPGGTRVVSSLTTIFENVALFLAQLVS